MIVIAGTLRIHSEMRERAFEIFRKLKQSSLDEVGCFNYHFYLDPDDDTLLFIFEQWENEKALQAHGWSSHMAEFRRQRATFIAGDVNIKRYDVKQVRDA